MYQRPSGQCPAPGLARAQGFMGADIRSGLTRPVYELLRYVQIFSYTTIWHYSPTNDVGRRHLSLDINCNISNHLRLPTWHIKAVWVHAFCLYPSVNL